MILTWDEDDQSAANHTVTIVVGPSVKPGSYDQRIDYFGVLRTIEELECLPPLGGAARTVPVVGICR